MNKISYFIPALLVLAFASVSCEKEPAVGTPLKPVEEEVYGPKLYINELDTKDNTVNLVVAQTQSGLVLPEKEFSFYVRLTEPLSEDVKVTVDEDTESGTMGGKTLNIKNATVTIPAGKIESAEPVRFTVQASEAIDKLETKGSTSLKIVSVTGNVPVGRNYNDFKVNYTKEVTNFKGFNSDVVNTLTQVDFSKYTVASSAGDYTADMSDGNTDTYLCLWAPWSMTLCFEEKQPVKAFAFQTGYATGYFPYRFQFYTSDDNENWTPIREEIITLVSIPSSINDAVVCEFYSPLACKYIQFEILNCYWGYYYGSQYELPIVSEVRLYK